MKRSLQTRGFVMMEIMPALLVMLLGMLIGNRLIWIRLSMEQRARVAALSSEAFAATWHHWANNGGKLAMAVREGSTGWEVVDLPSELWLPAPDRMRLGTFDKEKSILFRRSRRPLDTRTTGWIVDRLSADFPGDPKWIWYATLVDSVRIQPLAQEPSG